MPIVEYAPGRIPVYVPPSGTGTGFFIVAEAKAGGSGSSPGTHLSASGSNRPDLQLLANRNLGDGSTLVCDTGPAPGFPLGGVPGFTDPNFDPDSQEMTDAMNDLGCRMANNTQDPCTKDDDDNEVFYGDGTTVQSCLGTVLSVPLRFPVGDTRMSAQWRDGSGNIGFPASFIVRVPIPIPTPVP